MLLPNGKDSEIDEDDEQEGHSNLRFTLEQLKQMPKHSVDVCIACAGNKRKFLQKEFPNVSGPSFGIGALSNGKYTGVPVRYLIIDVMGLKENELGKGKHLITFNLDADF